MSCAVCLELLKDPVSAPCGHSFCKACFEKWRTGTKRNCDRCPTCREPLPETLKVNIQLRKMADIYRRQQEEERLQLGGETNEEKPKQDTVLTGRSVLLEASPSPTRSTTSCLNLIEMSCNRT